LENTYCIYIYIVIIIIGEYILYITESSGNNVVNTALQAWNADHKKVTRNLRRGKLRELKCPKRFDLEKLET